MSLVLRVSDTHFGTEQPRVVAVLLSLVREPPPDLVVLLGDSTQRACRSQFRVSHRFVLPPASRRQPLAIPLSTNHRGLATRWRLCTPAMGAGRTDQVWTLQDVLRARVLPWPQPHALSTTGSPDARERGGGRYARAPVKQVAPTPETRTERR